MKLFQIGVFVVAILFLGCSEDVKSKRIDNKLQSKEKDSISTIAGLPWHSDLESAFSLASKENKNVIVMVGEESCRFCKKMKEKTLIDVRIQKKLNNYILVSLKRSDKKSIKYISEFDGNIPSFFFMKSNKEMIEPVVGYFKPDDFLQYIEEIEE